MSLNFQALDNRTDRDRKIDYLLERFRSKADFYHELTVRRK